MSRIQICGGIRLEPQSFSVWMDPQIVNVSQAALRLCFWIGTESSNRKMPEGQYVRSWQDFEMLPGVAEAIGAVNRAGLAVFVVSNQRGVALGYYTAEEVELVHETLQKALNASGAHVDGFFRHMSWGRAHAGNH